MSTVGGAGGSKPPTVPTQLPETKPASDPGTKQAENPELAKASEQHAAQQMEERKMEGSVREAELRASLEKPEKKLNPNAPPLEYIEKGGAVAKEGQSGESIVEIKRSLNRNGATPPLTENDKFDSQTKDAVKEFQKKSKLPDDGSVGPDTLKKLLPDADSISKDPRIGKLNPDVQKEIADRMRKSPDDIGARARLLQVAGTDGFGKLAPSEQRQMLGILDKSPKDPALAADLGKLADSEKFRKLDVSTQSHALTQIGKHTKDPAARETLSKLTTSEGFQKLDTKEQERLLTMVGGSNKLVSKPAREALAEKMKGFPADGEGQAKELKGFLKDQNWEDWKTPTDAWKGRTTKPDSVTGPESVADGPFRLKDGPADKYTVKYGAKEIPVYVPAGTKKEEVDKLIGTMEALPKANRDLVNQVVLEREDDTASPRRFDAGGGTVRAYPEGMGLEPKDRRMSGMVHESAHLIDTHLQKKHGPQWDADWHKAKTDDQLVGSQYGKKSEAEDFAEAYLLYKVSKGTPEFDEYRAMFPNRFKLIDDIEKKADAGTL